MWRIFILAIIASSTSCTDDVEVNYTQYADTIPPVITLNGQEIDTAFLNTYYEDMSVRLLDEAHGVMYCVDRTGQLQTNGYVDTRVPGTYTISYKGTDMAGNESTTITRTVVVVPNAMEFLSGEYLVTYTCTVGSRANSSTTITTGNYKATVKPCSKNNHFELTALFVGPQYVVPQTFLNDGNIDIDLWYHNFQRADAKASVFPTKDGFTVNTQVFLFTPEYYSCVNVFKKQLIIKTLASK